MAQNSDEEDLKLAIEQTHNCSATFRKPVAVIEKHNGLTVWEGIVFVFDIEGHTQTKTAYAWSSAVEGSDKRRFYAVLKIPPVDSPQAAVRAAIVSDYKAGRSP